MPAFRPQINQLLIDSSSARIFTSVYPKQDTETVILLHGGPGVPMDFSPVAEHLSCNYQVIAFDQRGTGRSPAKGATYSLDEYLKDLDAVAGHFHLEKFHLFGHSWGGLYAQIYAEKNPHRLLSMFLSSPSSGTGEVWKQTEREVMAFNRDRAGFWIWSKMGIQSMFGMLGVDGAYRSLFKQVLENYNKGFDPTFKASDAMVENVRAEPINKTRPHILEYPLLKNGVDYPFPIMVTYGEKDIYGESRLQVQHRYPKARFVVIEQAGHIAWRQNKNRFMGILTEFYRMT
jgi:proline iminopeptidase